MKRIIMTLALVASLGLTSCSKDEITAVPFTPNVVQPHTYQRTLRMFPDSYYPMHYFVNREEVEYSQYYTLWNGDQLQVKSGGATSNRPISSIKIFDNDVLVASQTSNALSTNPDERRQINLSYIVK